MSETVLIIEDNQTLREGMAHVLQKMGCGVLTTDSGESGLKLIKEKKLNLIICDYKLPGITGIEVLEKIKSEFSDLEFLIVTAYGTIELAVDAIKKGAFDFLAKPFLMEEFQFKVDKMLSNYRQKMQLNYLNDEVKYLREQIETQFNFGEIIGSSSSMQKIYTAINKVAATNTSVLINGESGTGKELVARAIHSKSNRKLKPMVKVNCSALNENLLESELFGHEKGSFTGATRLKKGRFELANGGTIFLDEIGDISPNMQLKLLRILQEKEFERVGGEETLKVDVRVIAATNKNLESEVSEGRFRNDLYYRLNIIPILMPTLRERKEDIPYLVEHFLQKIGKEIGKEKYEFIDEAMQKMMDYHWPGNVRELENIVERSLVLTENKRISSKILPFVNQTAKTSADSDVLLSPGVIPLQKAVEQVEIKLISRALRYSNGNKAAAARLLGLKSNTLFYKMDRYNLGN